MNSQATVWPVIDERDRRLYVSPSELTSSQTAYVTRFFADLRRGPEAETGLDAQLLYGDTVTILETGGAVARVRNERDGYVGWVERDSLSNADFTPTHRVIAPRTFLYPQPDMKTPRSGYRSMGSLVTVVGEAETRGTRYALLAEGTAIIKRHIAPVSEKAVDFVAIAETLLHTPYLWGGNTAFGIDCSGLVQLSMLMAGRSVRRDTDMQAASIGEPLEIRTDWEKLQRGDLVFWRGHVAIAQGRIDGVPHLIHANGHTMDVTSEPADQAISRIAHLYELPIGVRRP